MDNTLVTDEELARIEKSLEALTPGPWAAYLEGRDHTSGSDFIMTGPADARGPDFELLGATKADYDFIAASRQIVPRLIATVRFLQSERHRQ